MKSTIGIVGRGFVGTALLEGMKHAFDVASYDKVKGWQFEGSVPAGYDIRYDNGPNTSPLQFMLQTTRIVFICLPTPMNPDGSCNVDIVESVVKELNELAVGMDSPTLVIKSTVIPGTTERLNNAYKNVRICFNPEFLTEANSINDFKNQDRIIIGGPHEATSDLKQIYQTAYPSVPVTKTSSTIAELVKYTTNCFLATKVSFANELKRICDGLEVDYDKVIEYATKDKRLGNSHWSVPGPDGRHGFGGSCFPKDLNGLISLAKELGMGCPTMEGAWETNLEVRPEKDWESLKGRAVL